MSIDYYTPEPEPAQLDVEVEALKAEAASLRAEVERLRVALEAIASEYLAALRASGGNYYIHALRHMDLTVLAAQHTGDKHE